MDDDRRSPFDADMNNVQPRFGFAYAVNPKTSVRGGYGLFYTLSRATVFGHTGGGFNVNATPTFTLDSNATRYATLANPYPNGMLLPPGRSLGDSTYLGLSAGTILPSNNRNPEYHSWNLSVQREIGWSSMFEANYTGSRGTHLFVPITTLTPLDQQVLVDGAHGADSRRTESVLRADHRSKSNQSERAHRAAVPAVAANAAFRRRQRRHGGACDRRFVYTTRSSSNGTSASRTA